MKITLYAIVSGETREEAIENAYGAFLELCHTESDAPGGTNPIFDWFRLYPVLAEEEDSRYSIPDSDGIHHTSEDETEELMDAVRDSMVDKFQSFEDDESGYAPACTVMRCRECLIYDEQARPVLSPRHYNNLIQRDDHWAVAALCRW
ncbi:hypothetical protein [Halopenitus persicus]|uniref:Uncharacterized protein n=1 Tax=Halopenitus persicus TaxID=1048396 RepID=A0A1H3NQM8_9EURY|nr:hypothetical protein [Halopenitus persicus]SDY91192.1 hypothetical protein SAMN05216564_11437 [Halopenitus persicus]